MSLDLKRFAERLRVTDGAWGTQLQRLGLPAGSPPELWNAENTSVVESVARGYVEAGSDIIITNTFGANRFVLEKHQADSRVAELAEAGAAISKRATAGTDVLVFGSIGPTGKIVMMEEVPAEELSAAYAETAGALAAGGADAIVLETFNELAEAEIALKAVRGTIDMPVVVSMTFASGPDKTATMMGDSPADLARMAELNGAAAVGANCGTGPDKYVAVGGMLRSATAENLPVWIKAHAGLPQVVDGETVFPMEPDEFASFVPQLIAAGTNFIGGCCGTTPDHIRAIRASVDER